MMIQILFMVAFMFTVTAYAMRRGEQPERSVAMLLLGTSVIDFFYHVLIGPPQFETVDSFHLVIDTVVLVGLFRIALHANRGWPLWACAAQLIVMVGHLAKLFEVRDTFRGYWAMTQVPFLLQLTVLLGGTAAHVARRRMIGRYPSWRTG